MYALDQPAAAVDRRLKARLTYFVVAVPPTELISERAGVHWPIQDTLLEDVHCRVQAKWRRTTASALCLISSLLT